VVVGFVVLSTPSIAHAQDTTAKAPANAAQPWCGSDSEALPNDVCYVDGRKKGERRTLVIWLHGVIAKNTNISWSHQKMLRRIAKQNGVELLFPHGTSLDTVYGWPGTIDSQEKSEQALIEQWMSAKTLLEKRDNRPFDEVFVFGFSSGAYFASSLAMRGRVDVDGYAVLAGGQPMPARATAVEHFAPVFVGVCANDRTTVSHSRAFAGSLAGAGIARMVSEDKIGHDVSELHFVQALTFLRNKTKAKVATGDAHVAPPA
jgi:predicted esterase